MLSQAKWISTQKDMGHVCPVFRKEWANEKEIEKAELTITALGVYEAKLNGKRVSEYVLAPGWTVYEKRLQVQQYDITELLNVSNTDSASITNNTNSASITNNTNSASITNNTNSASITNNTNSASNTNNENNTNTLTVTIGKGWFRSPMPGFMESESKERRKNRPCGLIGEIHLWYADGSEKCIATDETWEYAESSVRFSEIYDGETYDARLESMERSNVTGKCQDAADPEAIVCEENSNKLQNEKTENIWAFSRILDWPKDILIPQEGEEIREMERITAKSVFRTPKGELLVDFGQEVTGYVEFTVNAPAGSRVRILHGEVLDADGNFYNANYRSAKAEINYICKEGTQTWHPTLTFFGFRYIMLAEFPGAVEAKLNVETESNSDFNTGASEAKSDIVVESESSFTTGAPKPEQFTAISVRSVIRQTGEIVCGNPQINQLISNIFWSQKDNFLDVPTDCPQRDERLGWTGDAQVFVKTASYNYDVERFFVKWLHDMAAGQRPDGSVGQVIPDYLPEGETSAAWGDAATICPWQIYQTYGNRQILEDQFESMRKWVDYITAHTKDPGLWTGGTHFGDWLGLDAPSGSYKGASRDDLIATAFYAHSTELVIKAGKVIGADVSAYESLYPQIRKAFQMAYPDYQTQTEHVVALQFHLTDEPQKTADALAQMIREDGSRMRTGFVGTPYLLHVLSDYGHADLAYTLLLREEYPSWLYSVGKGATTIWEHWDGIMEDGSFWSTDMNSFNHYAYGSVADWIYEKAAGIQPIEDAAGFARVRIAPQPDARMGWLSASIDTRHGKIVSKWTCKENGTKYEITTPVEAEIVIGEQIYQVKPGTYTFWS